MFGLARHMIRRIGFVCLMLLTIAMTVPTAEAQVCAPAEATPAAGSVAMDIAPADSDGCGDCALSCAHGCCHASHVAIVGGDAVSLPKARPGTPAQWRHMSDQPPAMVGGPERPPRA